MRAAGMAEIEIIAHVHAGVLVLPMKRAMRVAVSAWVYAIELHGLLQWHSLLDPVIYRVHCTFAPNVLLLPCSTSHE